MLCDECGKNEAHFMIKAMVNGGIHEKNLCPECMKKYNIKNNAMDLKTLASVFGGLANLAGLQGLENVNDEKKADPDTLKLTCPSCGLSYAGFLKKGRLGCADCYKAFKTPLSEKFPEAFSRRHTGRIPVLAGENADPQMQLDKLMRKMQEAIDSENYEEAALLRDKIKAIKETVREAQAFE